MWQGDSSRLQGHLQCHGIAFLLWPLCFEYLFRIGKAVGYADNISGNCLHGQTDIIRITVRVAVYVQSNWPSFYNNPLSIGQKLPLRIW